MAVASDPSGAVAATTAMTMIDEMYEFSAPRFFDFINGETEEDQRRAELWFESALSYGPSPFMARIKTGRSIKVEALCDFGEAEASQKETELSVSMTAHHVSEDNTQCETAPAPDKGEGMVTEVIGHNERAPSNMVSAYEEPKLGEELDAGVRKGTQEVDSDSTSKLVDIALTDDKENGKSSVPEGAEVSTPKPVMASQKGDVVTNSKKCQTAKKIASLIKNPSSLRPKQNLQSSLAKKSKPECVKRNTNVKNSAATPTVAQENQAIKRQKLEGGKSRQILNVKPQILPHKSKLDLASRTSSVCSSSANKAGKEDRKVYVREPVPQFISTAEMMKKFQSCTRDLSLPHLRSSLSHDIGASNIQRKPTKLTLTRPKEPELETAQRIRTVRVKSTAELEEEMMAKIPKFKARPLNKKILEAPALPVLQRSTPKPPEFQEFHFETTSRANNNAESASVASTEKSHQNHQWKFHLTEPKTPLLQTSLRARPPRVKSSFELEQEELEKVPKFKARPLNKKIFESKGNMGMFCNTKRHLTQPQEFHFATDERFPQPTAVFDLFDKLSLKSEPRQEIPIPRNTAPNPFHLHTEERGAEKERKFVTELTQKQLEEERARIPRANPYPYTTDYPVIPPKPEPKHYTKPEPFQLESLVRHEEEMQREMEERNRKEKEEAQMRIFKAQPILKDRDPIPLPERARKPLTQVQEFNLHVDHRAVDRAEFDQKVKEKEAMYKRYREESEAAKMIEEERALKQLRKTLVPHARPIPKFDHPFCPQRSSKETTKAKSPNLRVLRRKEMRKAVTMLPAASSAAALMR
ncbi:protein TPX2 isoform X3 [Rhodamnia argentea]|uniref:Protein TPX2 isoform X3 n=1 Tax=Rhodamnia argentea TaxID=178133 RepID=A0A8B8QID5_9MYRT|nr:protein TPX2 isoform X3 [Rhodamnia argentea]